MIGFMPVRLDYALEKKALLVRALYEIFEEEAQKFGFICQPGCADCCTVNLLATSAEARFLLQALSEETRQELRERLKALRGHPRLRPKITPNEMATLCLSGKEPPEEEGYTLESCPFLDEQALCRIYQWRPFACRSFFSLKRCREVGEAVIPPEFLSLTTTFMQLLEEADLAGLYGNFFDLLDYLLEREERLKQGGEDPAVPDYLLSNREAPDFAIPPEHERYVRGVLAKLYRRPIGETTFKGLLDEVKEGAQVKEALSFLGEAL